MARKTATKSKKIIRGVDVPYANQYLLDPRQLTCWNAYIDPKSPTFGNALQSALKAGFSDHHAKQITREQWWTEKARKLNMRSKAERNLEEALELPSMTQAMGAFGPIFDMKEKKVKLKNGKTKIKKIKDKPVMVYNINLLALKNDTSRFVLERTVRDEWGNKIAAGGNNVLVINISGQSVERYGANIIPG